MSIFEPKTETNELLKSRVAPDDWTNPKPAEIYNLVIIGAGPCGLIAAAGTAGLGGKVALIERHAMGGDCLNAGCVPSKSLIRAARVAAELGHASNFGIAPKDSQIHFSTAMERMRRLRAKISQVDSVQRYQKELGVDVFLGTGAFKSTTSIEVDGQTLNFKKALIATGTRATKPPIPGLWESGAHTNETIFSLTELPKRLAVIGAGATGCELSQAFARLGSKVALFDHGPNILKGEDTDASSIIDQTMREDGVNILCETSIHRVSSNDDIKTIHYTLGDSQHTFDADAILVSVGRTPNIESLNLETAQISYHNRGIEVDDQLRTSNKRVFAAGDVAMKYQFTHTADAAARIVIQNALFHGRKKISDLVIPWCTFTDPEVAHVGMYEQDALLQGIEIDTYIQELGEVDRAVIDGQTQGFVKIHTKKGSPKIIGATIVANHAGDLISELTLAMTHGVGLDKVSSTIHPYPTQAEAIKKLGDAYSRTKLTPFVSTILKKWLAWSRQ